MITVQSSKTNFYYQPAFLASISSWSWTLLVLIMGVIFWLEVTHFNWITAAFFIGFIIICGVQYFTRSMLVQADKLVVNRSLQKSWLVMNVADIQTMKLTKFGISFMFNSDQYSFYLSKKNREYLFQTLKDKRAGIAG
ncbi:EbsA family protein [Pediococcus parvulus]|uniref:EbsA family protein n=1 Tax=Pediococcus parvulus TaxID=54062 RepID=UPI00070E3080|nr:pore-forming protein [Pediococcus parvulus]HBO46525.1 pore-forming protein [Pediococcus sp.]MCT3028475.1 pore-forming protein [Pediococcus parvulus]MCT3031444.1 pore-forming protein [Pediococcus parvulus]MCT3034110.1 pore-forming protein [Pediococcus parvulus]